LAATVSQRTGSTRRGRRVEKHIYLNEVGRYTLNARLKPTDKYAKDIPLPAGTTITQARKELHKLLHERDEGQGITLAPGSATVDEAWTRYLAELDALILLGQASAGTRDAAQNRYRKHVKPTFGKRKLDSIEDYEIVAWSLGLRTQPVGRGSRPLANRTTHACETTLRVIFREARSMKLTKHNPFASIDPRKLAPQENVNPDTPAPTMEEVFAVTDAVSDYIRPVVTMMALTGMRISEVLGLTWQVVEGKQLAVTQQLSNSREHLTTPKSKKSKRAFEIDAAIAAVLHEARLREFAKGLRPEPHRLVFTDAKGEPFRRGSVWSAMASASERLGKRVTPKDVRAAVATELANQGTDPRKAADYLGHTFAVHEARYVLPNRRDEQSAEVQAALRAGSPRFGA
jgi:integrase